MNSLFEFAAKCQVNNVTLLNLFVNQRPLTVWKLFRFCLDHHSLLQWGSRICHRGPNSPYLDLVVFITLSVCDAENSPTVLFIFKSVWRFFLVWTSPFQNRFFSHALFTTRVFVRSKTQPPRRENVFWMFLTPSVVWNCSWHLLRRCWH